MWRPSEEFRIPSWICVSIALAATAFGMWCGAKGWSAWDHSSGYERYASVVLLLFAGGSFVVAAIALMFARSRKLFWLGLAALFFIYAAGTQPKKRGSSAERDLQPPSQASHSTGHRTWQASVSDSRTRSAA